MGSSPPHPSDAPAASSKQADVIQSRAAADKVLLKKLVLHNSTSTFANPLRRTLTRRESIGLVFCCTFIGAAAQILMKIGAHNLPPVGPAAILANPLIILTNFALLGGLSLYGLFTLLLIFALRDGELSVIYPIIALNYVWVTILSLILFNETMNPFKACGITVIVLGVMVLGRSGAR